MASDPYFNYVTLLLRGYDSDGVTALTDESLSPKTSSRTGTTAQISTAQSLFNGSSIFTDGRAGSYFTFPDEIDLEFEAGDFTIEFRVHMTDVTTSQQGLLTKSGPASYGAFAFYAGAGGAITLDSSSNGGAWDIASGKAVGTCTAGVWHAVALTRSGTTFRTYFDGTKVSEWTSASGLHNGTHDVFIGSFGGNSTYSAVDTYFAEIRFTKGYARYTGTSYTVATESFAPYTLAGNIYEDFDITDWNVAAYRCSDGVKLDLVVSTDGTYSVIAGGVEPYNIMLSPKIDYSWSASKVAVSGDYVVAANPDTTPHIWKCTTGGTTHATTEPTWNLSGTTSDGTVTWTYLAPLVNPVVLGPKVPT